MPCQSKKRFKEDLTHRYCPYCKANRDNHGFDKHQAACRVIWELRCRQQNPAIRESGRIEKQVDDGINFPTSAEVDSEVMFNLPMAYVRTLIFNRMDLFGWAMGMWKIILYSRMLLVKHIDYFCHLTL